ncbi:MAG: hypothetical protein F4X11_01925 [Acidobacteria bacterium]|nr:hypothetical protein [Acidobacteriota bacterium]
MMDTLYEPLAAILNEASFEMEHGEGDGPGRRVSAAELRAIYSRVDAQAVRRRARLLAPSALLAQFVDALRLALEPVIDPDTDRIGHAFPIDMDFDQRSTLQAGGYCDQEFTSLLPDFARVAVQAAAIIGVDATVRLLADWNRGEPVRLHLSTVLNNLPLSAAVSLRDDIRLVPLPLTTSELPRVPVVESVPARDLLGLTMLKLHISASPTLFRPDAASHDQVVRSKPAAGADLDLVCELLSLQANRHVARSVVWHDYPDAAPFRLAIREIWSQGDDRPRPRRWKGSSHARTGAVTIVPADEPVQRLDPDRFRHLLTALGGAHRKLRIALDRWRRSKRATLPVDAYIELRIALEALYLKDFADENSGELRFRLALMGAWHLTEDPEERRSIRKTLRDAYDTASGAVHTGEIKDEHRVKLSDVQDLCRRGILKLLREGPPQDWGDLVLGAGVR